MDLSGKFPLRDDQKIGAPSQMRSGRAFYAESPDYSGMFEVSDLINGLAREGRYGNQLDFHYGVAQHSVLVAYFAKLLCEMNKYPREATAEIVWDALWHDGSEGTPLVDVVRGVKRALKPLYMPMELRAMKEVAKLTGCREPSEWHPHVLEADNMVLSAEAHSFGLVRKRPDLWVGLPEWPRLPGARNPYHVMTMTAEHAIGFFVRTVMQFGDEFEALRKRAESVIDAVPYEWRNY